jgi:hypothetical protein
MAAITISRLTLGKNALGQHARKKAQISAIAEHFGFD